MTCAPNKDKRKEHTVQRKEENEEYIKNSSVREFKIVNPVLVVKKPLKSYSILCSFYITNQPIHRGVIHIWTKPKNCKSIGFGCTLVLFVVSNDTYTIFIYVLSTTPQPNTNLNEKKQNKDTRTSKNY